MVSHLSEALHYIPCRYDALVMSGSTRQVHSSGLQHGFGDPKKVKKFYQIVYIDKRNENT